VGLRPEHVAGTRPQRPSPMRSWKKVAVGIGLAAAGAAIVWRVLRNAGQPS